MLIIFSSTTFSVFISMNCSNTCSYKVSVFDSVQPIKLEWLTFLLYSINLLINHNAHTDLMLKYKRWVFYQLELLLTLIVTTSIAHTKVFKTSAKGWESHHARRLRKLLITLCTNLRFPLRQTEKTGHRYRHSLTWSLETALKLA